MIVEVNLKRKGEVHGRDYTCRRRPGEAGHPGSRGGCHGSSDRRQAAAARWVHGLVCAVAARLPRRDGGLLGLAPLGPAVAGDGPAGEADRAALRLALPTERQDWQERCSGCGGDLRSGLAAQHPLRAGQERRAAEQRALHRWREGYKEERTACINRIRGLLAEFGLVFAQRPEVLRAVLSEVVEDASNELGAVARMALQRAHLHWVELECHIAWCDERIAMHVKSDKQAKAAAELCGIGPVTASALVATVDDFKQFKNGRQFSAWMGLVPRQSSSGGKSVLGEITKRGDEYLRTLLIQGAKSAVFTAHRRSDRLSRWIVQLRERVGWQKAAVALANKHARTLWSILVNGQSFDPEHVATKHQMASRAATPAAAG